MLRTIVGGQYLILHFMFFSIGKLHQNVKLKD